MYCHNLFLGGLSASCVNTLGEDLLKACTQFPQVSLCYALSFSICNQDPFPPRLIITMSRTRCLHPLGNRQALTLVLDPRHRPTELGTKIIPDSDRFSLEVPLFYPTCYQFIVLPDISWVLIWYFNSTNIVDHPSFWNMTAPYILLSICHWAYFLLFPLTNLQAHAFRLLGSLFSSHDIFSSWTLLSILTASNTSHVQRPHTFITLALIFL